jgi:hypothetical protein
VRDRKWFFFQPFSLQIHDWVFGTASSSFFLLRRRFQLLSAHLLLLLLLSEWARIFGNLENPVEDQKVEWVDEQENDADAVSTTLGFTEGLPPTSGVVEVLNE